MFIEPEIPTTGRVLEAVPDDQAAYRPHEKSMSAGELAEHIATADNWFLESILAGSFRMEGGGSTGMAPSAAAALYKTRFPALLDQVRGMGGEDLAKPVDFFGMLNLPNVLYLNFLLKHSVHHRGQLSAYLRPMGAKVPSIYGGSADEPMSM